MPADVYCRVCDTKHGRPVGRNCNKAKVGDAAALASSVVKPAQASASSVLLLEVGNQILTKLSAIDAKLVSRV